MQSAWTSLLTTDYGWMTVAVFVFMLGMGVFFVLFFRRRIRDEEARARAQGSDALKQHRPG
jgi:protein-S-isoprenylcysteine O-methyltransferase Ste14